MNLEVLKEEKRRITAIFCGGFESRAVVGAELFAKLDANVENVVLMKFGGKESQSNWHTISKLAQKMCAPSKYFEFGTDEYSALQELLAGLSKDDDLVVFDVTGCSRTIMMNVLSIIYDSEVTFDVLYTEAEEYYPTFEAFEELTQEGDFHSAYLKQNEFEESEVLHSSHCVLEEFEDLRGQMLPNYPLFLIAFLPFKRGRLSAILQALETNVRVLIRGRPVRDDLIWRGDAVDIPNADLLHKSRVFDLETLDWRKTYDFLVEQFEGDQNKYKFNFIVAPLGSKMQTFGCWLFAKERSEVRVITSTPKHHYPDKYSLGSGETFLFRGFSKTLGSFARLDAMR